MRRVVPIPATQETGIPLVITPLTHPHTHTHTHTIAGLAFCEEHAFFFFKERKGTLQFFGNDVKHLQLFSDGTRAPIVLRRYCGPLRKVGRGRGPGADKGGTE